MIGAVDGCVCCTLCRIFVSKMWNIFCLVINVQIFSSSYFWRTLYQCRVCVLWCLLLQSCSVEGFNSKTTLKTSMSDVVLSSTSTIRSSTALHTTGTQGSTQAADQTTLPKAEFFPSFNFSSFSSCKTAKRRRLLVEVCCNNIEKCPLPAIMVRISSSLEGVFVFFHNLLRETFRNVIFARCGALGPSCSISSKN